MQTALYWLLAFFVFGLLIFVHEMGHYLTARACHVKIYEFSIGMGPKMITYESKKTGIKYSIGVFLFGGYVSMAGEDEESDDPNAFSRKPAWQRFIIAAAGGVVNLLFGFLLVLLCVALSGSALGSTRVANPYPHTPQYEDVTVIPAADSGIMAGDIILAVDGKRVHIADELSYEIMHNGNAEIPLTIRRGDETLTLNVKFATKEESGITYAIPGFVVQAEERNVGSVLHHALHRSLSTVKMIWDSLFDLIRGRYGMEAVSGPIGVAGALSDAAAANFLNFLYLVAVISVNLGVVNLLPLPALDGGRLLFLLFEMIARRPVPVKYEGIIHFVGLILLLLLMVAITFKDLVSLFS